jgi:hypothetical protein
MSKMYVHKTDKLGNSVLIVEGTLNIEEFKNIADENQGLNKFTVILDVKNPLIEAITLENSFSERIQ